MKEKRWHGKVIELFYSGRKNIVDIEAITGITRKTISVFLQNENPSAFEAEKNKRKEDTKIRTHTKKKEWAMENPEKVGQCQLNYKAGELGMSPEEYEIYLFQRAALKDELQQQHENDVMEMSAHGMPKTISCRELEYYGSGYRQTKSGRYVRLDVTKDGAAVPTTLPRRI